MDVVIWDYTRHGTHWLSENLNPKVKVVRVIVPEDDDQDYMLKRLEYDYLLIAEEGMRDLFASIIDALGIPIAKVLYIFDKRSWISHPEAGSALMKHDCPLYRQSIYLRKICGQGKHVLVNVGDLSYVGSSNDKALLLWMYSMQKNFAEDEIHLFYRLAQKYYPMDYGRGWFVDIGANIGTTAIYFKKCIAPKTCILAFEVDPETYRFLQTNVVLNEMGQDVILENIGLDEGDRSIILHRNAGNPGGNSAIKNYGEEDLMVRTTSLDAYLAKSGIDGRDVKYIWIDVEGFEPQVLEGARRLISTFDIPVFMEFNPELWSAAGRYDELMELLKELYGEKGGYIVSNEAMQGREVVHRIDELWAYKDTMEDIPGMDDIFLVKQVI